jgi:hypothetical protein
VQHRPAPHDGLVLLEEETDRHQLQVAADRRDDHPVDRHRLLVNAEQVRDRVPVDIGVEDPGPLAEAVEGGGEVGCQRRLADAAFAAGDGDHARRAVELDAFRPLGDRATQARRQGAALLGRHHAELERDTLHALDRRERLRDLLLEARAKRATGDGERDADGDVAALDPHVAHHVELDDVPLELGGR